VKNGDPPSLDDVRALLQRNGKRPVLLYIQARQKGPLYKDWPETTFEQTQTIKYQRLLLAHSNTGVLLGVDNLCAIDCDTEAFLTALLELNPRLGKTLRTRGARGCQFWAYIVGARPGQVHQLKAPKDSPLAVGGKLPDKDGFVRIGEFRAEGGQSVIRGVHEDGCLYCWPCSEVPIEIDFDEIVWPDEIELPWKPKARYTSRPGGGGAHGEQGSSDTDLLQRAKERLSIDFLWKYFGFPERRGNPTNSPFREDNDPSFSVYDDGRHFKDHGTDDQGDSFDFYQRAMRQDASQAFAGFIELAGLGEELRRNRSEDSKDTKQKDQDGTKGKQSDAEQQEAKTKERTLAFSQAITKGSKLLEIEIPPRKVIIDDWYKEGDLGFVFAYRGTGKTWLVVSLCIALADSGECGPWKVQDKWPVLYVDGEMSHDDDQNRISGLQQEIPEELCVLNHEVLFHFYGLVMNLGNPVDQEVVTKICLDKGIKVLVLDNLGCLFSGVGENEADEWEKILPWLLELRRHRISVIVVHHSGHDSTRMRGTVKREDSAAWVLRLDDQREDYTEAGAKFISRFKKLRGKKPAPDYEWHFEPCGDGTLVTYKEANRADVVLQWVRDGLTSCSAIAREMGLTEGTVSKIATKLIRNGELKKKGREYVIP
jgi:putative DNA primase/helicase